MKQAAIVLAIFFASCKVQQVNTSLQNHSYEISRDAENGAKVLKGLLTRSDIENDTAFAWFKENYQLGTTNAGAIEVFKKNIDSFHIVIFGGTWCSDTQNLLPQFFRLADKAGLPEKNITLIGVDRTKATLGNLSAAFHIQNVPTFIVMKNGKETGRVVEYGKYGQIDKELAEIISGN